MPQINRSLNQLTKWREIYSHVEGGVNFIEDGYTRKKCDIKQKWEKSEPFLSKTEESQVSLSKHRWYNP